MSGPIIAIVGRSEAEIERIIEACEALAVLCTANGVGDSVHPSEIDDELRILGAPLVATTHSPYALDHFAAEHVWCALRLADDVVAARLSEHPDWPTWRGKFQTGEFWSSVDEGWIADVQHVVGLRAIAEQIAEYLHKCAPCAASD